MASFGIDRDLSLELDVLTKTNVSLVAVHDPALATKDFMEHAARIHRLPDRLTYEPKALAKVDGTVSLFASPTDAMHFQRHSLTPIDTTKKGEAAEAGVRTRFPAVRLATALARLPIRPIAVVKMDVAGAEWSVLLDDVCADKSRLGADEVGFPAHQLLLEVHYYKGRDNATDLVRRLARCGLKLFHEGPRLRVGPVEVQQLSFARKNVGGGEEEGATDDEDLAPPQAQQHGTFTRFSGLSSKERARITDDRRARAAAAEPAAAAKWATYETVWDRRGADTRGASVDPRQHAEYHRALNNRGREEGVGEEGGVEGEAEREAEAERVVSSVQQPVLVQGASRPTVLNGASAVSDLRAPGKGGVSQLRAKPAQPKQHALY